MGVIYKTVEGSLDLEAIESAIQFQEAKSCELAGWAIEHTGKNKLSFNKLKLGTIPNDLKLTKKGDPDPADYQEILNGKILVKDDDVIDIIAWRISSDSE